MSHPRIANSLITATALVVVLCVSACSGGGTKAQTPAATETQTPAETTTQTPAETKARTPTQFERAMVTATAHKQWGTLYDNLHPAHQKVIRYKDFQRCMVAANLMAKGVGLDLSSLRPVSATVVKHKRMTIPGTRVSVLATVVRTKSSILNGQGGVRVVESELGYVTKVNNGWRWIDPTLKPAYFKPGGNCGVK